MDVIIFAVGIYRNIVVTVACDAQKLGILIKAVASAGIGNQGEEILSSQIVDPWKRGVRGSDDIFFCLVIKLTEFHKKSSYLL